MGHLDNEEALFYEFSFDHHIPQDHLLRQIDRFLDFSLIRSKLSAHYSHTGRPSIDPELMLRMLLVGYLYGIRSERRLVEEIHFNLAYRWFCRLGLNSEVPDRSTFSKNRHGRFRESGIFRELFEQIVRQCMENGLVGGSGMAIDGSLIEADASYERRLPGDVLPVAWADNEAVSRPVKEYLEALNEQAGLPQDAPKPMPLKHLSETDPQSAWSMKSGAGRFGYFTNYLIDTDHAIIVDVDATPARTSGEIIAARHMIKRSADTFNLKPVSLAADTGYGTGPFLSWLIKQQIEPHIPVLDRKHQTKGKITRDAFTYDPVRNAFICPEGKFLDHRASRKKTRLDAYASRPQDCKDCPIANQCRTGTRRIVTRMWDEEARETVRRLSSTRAYEISMCNRKKVEMLFAHLKRHLNLRRLKLRGLAGANEEFLLAATAQNLKRLVKLVPT